MQSQTWGVTPHPHPHMGTAVTQGWGGCWGQQGRNGAFQVFAVKKEREKKAKSSKTEQLSKEQPGWFHSQPHCVMHGLGDSFPHNTSLSRTLELTVPGINPNQNHDPMDAPGAGSSTGPSTTRTRGLDGSCHDAKHGSDRFFPQTHDITLLSRKKHRCQLEIVVLEHKYSLFQVPQPIQGDEPILQAGGASFQGVLPSPHNQSSLELLQLLQFPPLTPH